MENTRGELPLDLAAQYGRLQAVQILVRANPELLLPYKKPGTHIFNKNFSPLHLASRNGHIGVVEVLLAAGVDVSIIILDIFLCFIFHSIHSNAFQIKTKQFQINSILQPKHQQRLGKSCHTMWNRITRSSIMWQGFGCENFA